MKPIHERWPRTKTLRSFMRERSWYWQRNAWVEWIAHPIELFHLWRDIRAMRRLDAVLDRTQGDIRQMVSRPRASLNDMEREQA